MHRVNASSRVFADLCVASVLAVIAAVAAILLGPAGAVLVLGPDDAEKAGVAYGTRSAR